MTKFPQPNEKFRFQFAELKEHTQGDETHWNANYQAQADEIPRDPQRQRAKDDGTHTTEQANAAACGY